MDRRRTLLFAFFLALGLLCQPTLRAHGDDDHDDDDQGEDGGKVLVVKVQGPIDAIDLSATPPTITVLGLVIDISTAGTDSGSRECGCDGSGSSGSGGGSVVFLTVGQNVEVVLKDSKSPFVAKTVTPKSGYDEKVAISAPIEAVDATAKTITLLGLVIDASTATIEKASSGGSSGSSSRTTFTTGPTTGGTGGTTTSSLTFADLKVGQFVDATLDGTQLPALVALNIAVQQTGNCVDIDVDDDGGQSIDVDITVTIKITITGPDGKTTTITKDIHIHYTIKGSVTLAGLPDGKANVQMTRADGQKVAKKLSVKGNRTKKLKAHFKRAKSHR
jgi:hypothetical protein